MKKEGSKERRKEVTKGKGEVLKEERKEGREGGR
jgi:hypothetical protein